MLPVMGTMGVRSGGMQEASWISRPCARPWKEIREGRDGCLGFGEFSELNKQHSMNVRVFLIGAAMAFIRLSKRESDATPQP